MTAIQDGLIYFVFVAIGLAVVFAVLAAVLKSASDADDARGYDEEAQK